MKMMIIPLMEMSVHNIAAEVKEGLIEHFGQPPILLTRGNLPELRDMIPEDDEWNHPYTEIVYEIEDTGAVYVTFDDEKEQTE